MGEIDQCCASLCISHLKWDEPTHYKGRCINHIFFLSKALVKQLFINAILSGFKDHVLLIEGSIMEFLYDANILIFDWFCFNLEEKRVLISKYERKV